MKMRILIVLPSLILIAAGTRSAVVVPRKVHSEQGQFSPWHVEPGAIGRSKQPAWAEVSSRVEFPPDGPPIFYGITEVLEFSGFPHIGTRAGAHVTVWVRKDGDEINLYGDVILTSPEGVSTIYYPESSDDRITGDWQSISVVIPSVQDWSGWTIGYYAVSDMLDSATVQVKMLTVE